MYLLMAAERSEQREAVADGVGVEEAAFVALLAITGEEVPADLVAGCGRSAAADRALSTLSMRAAAGAGAMVGALEGRLGELAVEVAAGEEVAAPGAPVGCRPCQWTTRRRCSRRARSASAQAVVHALVAVAAVRLKAHVRSLVGSVGFGRRRSRLQWCDRRRRRRRRGGRIRGSGRGRGGRMREINYYNCKITPGALLMLKTLHKY